MTSAVVILNYNGKNYLEQFLPSVIAHSGDAVIYVADNCSSDDSVQFVKDNYPNIKLIENDENGGFAKGYNDALKHVEEDIYVLLNSDIEVTENWTGPCLKMLKENPEIAAVQPKILAYLDKGSFEHAGAAGGFLDKEYYPFCQGRIFDCIEEDKGQYNQSREVFWATGACMFIRKDIYREFDGLDEDFFAHMEEIDLCWRIKGHNHQIWYCAESSVYHVGGGTLNYNNPKKTYLNFRNSLFMILKNHHGPWFAKMFWRMMLDGLAAAVFLFKFEFSNFAAVLKSHFTFYMNIRSTLRKRKEIKQNRRTFNPKGMYKGAIVFKRFLSGLNSFQDLDEDKFV